MFFDVASLYGPETFGPDLCEDVKIPEIAP
jgi:hypothetical protein